MDRSVPDAREIDSAAPSSGQDPLLYRILVIGLLAVILVVVIGCLVLAALKVVDQELILVVATMAAAIAGYLGGLLTPKPQA